MSRWLAIVLCIVTLGAQSPPAYAVAVKTSDAAIQLDADHDVAPKRVGRIAFAAVAAAVALFVLASLIVCLRGPARHWPFLLAIPLGIGRAALDWKTGMVMLRLIHLQLPSASFSLAHGTTGLTISMGVPVFAFIFWAVRAAQPEAPLRDAGERR